MKFLYRILILIAVVFPLFTNAQVVINEVAWMGMENSANDEWMELKNIGAENVDLSGWTLEAQDGSPKIELSGIISAGAFFLLERTDDSSVPSVTADQIYSGALSNSGEVLVLKDAFGAEADRVDGSNDWALGGDKNLKYTLQRSGSSWVTAEVTPRVKNRAIDAMPEGGDNVGDTENNNNEDNNGGDAMIDVISDANADTEQESEKTVSESASQSSGARNIRADAGKSIIAEAGQEIFFDGSSSEGDRLSFYWNLGNGEVREGENFLYAYKFPGDYLVSLTVRSGSYKDISQINVTVYPAGVLVSEFYIGPTYGDSWLEAQNTSDNYVDMSFWNITSDNDVFVVPEKTFLAPHGYIVFSGDVLGERFFKDSKKISLLYPNGQASDVVNYEFFDNEFSASRKNENEFVWTSSKTPGAENITVASGTEPAGADEMKVNREEGVSVNIIKKKWASFVVLDDKKSFLIKPAHAEVVGVRDDRNMAEKYLPQAMTANVSSMSSFGNLLFVFVAGMMTALGAFWLGKRRV